MESDFCNCLRIDDLLTPLSKKQKKKNGRTANKLKKKKNEMNCVLLCKNRIALRLLTYDCDSGRRRKEKTKENERENE